VVSLGGWQIRDAGGQPVPGLRTAGTPQAAVELVYAELDGGQP
jgi:hypothetical protein